MLRMCWRAGGRETSFDYPRRDLSLLSSVQWPEALAWHRSVGNYENFSIARGQVTAAWVHRDIEEVRDATRTFEAAVRRDADFVAHDYAFRMPAERIWQKTRSNCFPFGEDRGEVRAGPGTLYMDVYQGEYQRGPFLRRIDLRGLSKFDLAEHASISIKQIPAASCLPQMLAAMCAFLSGLDGQVAISHGYVEKASEARKL
jgi:hypothetical protein